MKVVHFDSKFWVPWIQRRIGGQFDERNAVGFGVVDLTDRKPLGGVIFDGVLGTTIRIHVAADTKRWMTREFLFTVCDYPFNQLGVTKLIGLVRSDLSDTLAFDTKFGFEQEGRIAEIDGPDVDLLILTMTRDRAERWLKLGDKIDRTKMVA